MNCTYVVMMIISLTLGKPYYKVLPLVSCHHPSLWTRKVIGSYQGSRSLNCSVLGHPHSMFFCGVFCFAKSSSDPEILDCIIFVKFFLKEYMPICIMLYGII